MLIPSAYQSQSLFSLSGVESSTKRGKERASEAAATPGADTVSISDEARAALDAMWEHNAALRSNRAWSGSNAGGEDVCYPDFLASLIPGTGTDSNWERGLQDYSGPIPDGYLNSLFGHLRDVMHDLGLEDMSIEDLSFADQDTFIAVEEEFKARARDDEGIMNFVEKIGLARP